MSGRPDEFAWIASLRALCRGDPRALDLTDDAAIIPSRPGYDLVISKDAMVEGVHFLAGENPEIIARRLLRTSLSDLAAKAAEPFGYFLLTAWPPRMTAEDQAAFARGLALDGETFKVALLGGDTVATPGPLTLSATVLGWAPAGRAVLRSGARPGDRLIVCGQIGDGWLGLLAAQRRLADPEGRLAAHYRLPMPLLGLCPALRAHARAAADVSDGLLADAGHLAEASGLRVRLDLDLTPLSVDGLRWRREQSDVVQATLALASGGDDYALVCAVAPEAEGDFIKAVADEGVPAVAMGAFEPGAGVEIQAAGVTIRPRRLGWRH